MDDKRRSKRAKISEPDGFWDCSVCTYRNAREAFKCDMCDTRKGTSTRKPQINAQLVAQQVATQQFALPPVKKEKSLKKTPTSAGTSPQAQNVPTPGSSGKKTVKSKDIKGASTPASSKPKRPPRLKNIDRSTGFSMDVTVNNVTVTITDYKPKKEKEKKDRDLGGSALSSPTVSPSASSSVTSLSPSPSVSSSVVSPVTSSMSSDNQNNNVTGLPTSSDSPRSSSMHLDKMLDNSNSSPDFKQVNGDVELEGK